MFYNEPLWSHKYMSLLELPDLLAISTLIDAILDAILDFQCTYMFAVTKFILSWLKAII